MKRVRGFTLIEMMIVVAIIALLASIAIPNYNEYITKSRRGQAKACLQEMAQFMERFYTTNMRYDQTPAAVAVALPAGGCRTESNLATYYTIALDPAFTAPRTFRLEAVPQGVQLARDGNVGGCGTLRIDETGARTRTGDKPIAECW